MCGEPPPLRHDMLTDQVLVSVAELLLRYHQAAASFEPDDYQWPRRIPARFTTGLVSHNDVHPANLIFRDLELMDEGDSEEGEEIGEEND